MNTQQGILPGCQGEGIFTIGRNFEESLKKQNCIITATNADFRAIGKTRCISSKPRNIRYPWEAAVVNFPCQSRNDVLLQKQPPPVHCRMGRGAELFGMRDCKCFIFKLLLKRFHIRISSQIFRFLRIFDNIVNLKIIISRMNIIP